MPLILMGYTNNFFTMGEKNFADAARTVGVDGVIVVDLPPEEGDVFYPALKEAGVAPILLASPTTTPGRVEKLAEETRGFLYYVSLTGVTGARDEIADGVEESVRAIRKISDVPHLCGLRRVDPGPRPTGGGLCGRRRGGQCPGGSGSTAPHPPTRRSRWPHSSSRTSKLLCAGGSREGRVEGAHTGARSAPAFPNCRSRQSATRFFSSIRG